MTNILIMFLELLVKFGLYEVNKLNEKKDKIAIAKAEAKEGVNTGDDTKLVDGIQKIKDK